MTALANGFSGIRPCDEDPNIGYYGLYAGKAYQGGIAVLSGGYVQPGSSSSGQVCVGIFDFSGDVMEGTMDNTGGAAGAMNARVRRGTFRFINDTGNPMLATDVGTPCYILDDNTITKTSSGSVAGTLKRIDGSYAWVEMGSVNGTSLTAEIAARALITTNLALTTTPGGASYVGIYDSAGKITATTVEGALAEGIDGRRIATTVGTGVGRVPVMHVITVPTGSTPLDALTLDATYGGMVVTDVVAIKTGSTGTSTDAIQLCTDSGGSTAVSSSIGLVIAAGVLAKTTSLANNTFAAGAHFYVKRTQTTDCSATLIVSGYRA